MHFEDAGGEGGRDAGLLVVDGTERGNADGEVDRVEQFGEPVGDAQLTGAAVGDLVAGVGVPNSSLRARSAAVVAAW
ncbi:MAG: hypothetical protein ACTH1D_07385 [Mycobacteriaceae bacterium]